MSVKQNSFGMNRIHPGKTISAITELIYESTDFILRNKQNSSGK
jgi:hypothetical protein